MLLVILNAGLSEQFEIFLLETFDPVMFLLVADVFRYRRQAVRTDRERAVTLLPLKQWVFNSRCTHSDDSDLSTLTKSARQCVGFNPAKQCT